MTLDKAFGIELDRSQHSALTPFREYDQLIRDEVGTIVAELHSATLYVLFDLPDGRNAGTLMTKIMERCVADYLVADPEERKRRVEERQLKLYEQSWPIFEKAYTNMLLQKMDSFRNEDRSLEEEEWRFTQRINGIKDRREALLLLSEQTQSFLKKNKRERKGILSESFQRLSRMSANGCALVIGSKIYIDMGQIDIENKGQVYDIGHFELVIDIGGDGGEDMTCENKTRTVAGCMDHPHIRSKKVCLGNIRSQVRQLTETMQYDLLVTLMKAYLESYNASDAFFSIEHWPVKS